MGKLVVALFERGITADGDDQAVRNADAESGERSQTGGTGTDLDAETSDRQGAFSSSGERSCTDLPYRTTPTPFRRLHADIQGPLGDSTEHERRKYLSTSRTPLLMLPG